MLNRLTPEVAKKTATEAGKIDRLNALYPNIVLNEAEKRQAVEDYRLYLFRVFRDANPTSMVTLDSITLTPEDHARALMQARGKIQARETTEAYWKKVNQPIKAPTYTAEQMYSFIQGRAQMLLAGQRKNHQFEIDDYNRSVISALCLYFTGDERFLKLDPNFSFDKGIGLIGPIGCGKTFIMQLFSLNQRQSFRVVNVLDIAGDYTIKDHGGDEAIRRYVEPIATARNYFGQTSITTCFDDLGTEDDKNHMGNRVNVMQDLLLRLYARGGYQDYALTTNLTATQVEERYGSRVRDRMRDMFNPIIFPLFDNGKHDSNGQPILENKTRRR